MSAIELSRVGKRYRSPGGQVDALRDVSLRVPRGRMTAIMGPSGSGKSTLMQCAAGLDRPDTGRVLLGDTELHRASEATMSRIRRERIGFVFQAFNLLDMLNVHENVDLPLRLAGKRPRRATVRARLEQVGLAGMERRRPTQLSGGQRQRVAIARALVTRPEVVFADEPTGALDRATGDAILDILRMLVDTNRQTVLLVTHDARAAARADAVVYMVDGAVRDVLENPTVVGVAALAEVG